MTEWLTDWLTDWHIESMCLVNFRHHRIGIKETDVVLNKMSLYNYLKHYTTMNEINKIICKQHIYWINNGIPVSTENTAIPTFIIISVTYH